MISWGSQRVPFPWGLATIQAGKRDRESHHGSTSPWQAAPAVSEPPGSRQRGATDPGCNMMYQSVHFLANPKISQEYKKHPSTFIKATAATTATGTCVAWTCWWTGWATTFVLSPLQFIPMLLPEAPAIIFFVALQPSGAVPQAWWDGFASKSHNRTYLGLSQHHTFGDEDPFTIIYQLIPAIHAAPRQGPLAPQWNSVPSGVFWGQVFVMSGVGRNGPNGRSVAAAVALWVFCTWKHDSNLRNQPQTCENNVIDCCRNAATCGPRKWYNYIYIYKNRVYVHYICIFIWK